MLSNVMEVSLAAGLNMPQTKQKKVNDWLPAGMRLPEALKGIPGTAEAYEYYAETMKIGAAYNAKTGKRCEADLIPQFIGHEGKRVEVTYKNGTTAKFRIGKSAGWFPCHLEMHPRQRGGDSVTPFESFKFLNR